jgi:hypothetical protein
MVGVADWFAMRDREILGGMIWDSNPIYGAPQGRAMKNIRWFTGGLQATGHELRIANLEKPMVKSLRPGLLTVISGYYP